MLSLSLLTEIDDEYLNHSIRNPFTRFGTLMGLQSGLWAGAGLYHQSKNDNKNAKKYYEYSKITGIPSATLLSTPPILKMINEKD